MSASVCKYPPEVHREFTFRDLVMSKALSLSLSASFSPFS